jgi:hypothetical protein
MATSTPVNMPVVPVSTTNIAITTQSGAPPNPNASAVCRVDGLGRVDQHPEDAAEADRQQ